MAWYKEWFGNDYLSAYPHRNAEEARQQVDFVESTLPLQRTDRILDLGCGSGRHAYELAIRGYRVTCLDLSIVLLKLAQKSLRKAQARQLVRADMRHIPFCQTFDAVVSFFTTFGYFQTDKENLATLESIEHALKPGGIFMQDYLNKSYVIQNLVAWDERDENGLHIIQERTYNREQERIEKKIEIRSEGKNREYFESVRLYTLAEMQALFAATGLTLERTYGDFDGQPFSETSPRLILIGKRRGND